LFFEEYQVATRVLPRGRVAASPRDEHHSRRCVLALDGEKILAVETAHRPGELSLPGGSADPGEDPLRAAIREALEETGLVVELAPDRLHVGPASNGGPLVATFPVRSFQGELRPGSDVVLLRWVSAAELLDECYHYAAYNRTVLAAAALRVPP
jgi:8-oxo-dGTP pyrophosphatase MutT (NUDIX family)